MIMIVELIIMIDVFVFDFDDSEQIEIVFESVLNLSEIFENVDLCIVVWVEKMVFLIMFDWVVWINGLCVE